MNDIKRHFDQLSIEYNTSSRWREESTHLNWIMEKLKYSALTLDIGAGTGLLSAAVKNEGNIVVAIDISTKMLDQGREGFHIAVIGDITKLPFLNEQFDGIIIRQVLHYVDDISCLEEANRVLKKEGKICCIHAVAPDEASLKFWEKIKTLVQPLRKRVYEYIQLQKTFEGTGFKIIDQQLEVMERVDSWTKFLINSNDPNVRQKVEETIMNLSDSVHAQLKIRVGANSIQYLQHWALIEALKK